MSNNIFFVLIFILSFVSLFTNAESELRKRYSDVLLTDDYGILKENDLLMQIKSPGREASKWQCFLSKDVKLSYETWKDVNERGEMDVLYDYSFYVESGKTTHYFIDRRAKNYESFWQIIYPKWKRIKKSGKFICINGVTPSSKNDNNEVSWFWNVFITKTRCLSYFSNDCYREIKKQKYEDEVLRSVP